MSAKKEIPPTYTAQEAEPKWREAWEKSNLFHADPKSKKPAFCVMMPPPNVTGVLHMGHALDETAQDILVRWKKMSGFETLWMPGTDHAGIATQTVVEKHLLKTTGKRRIDFSRDEFLQHVWDWVEKSQATILGQIRAIGCSCDWPRQRFSMDEGCNKAVRALFKKLFDQGLIYRGNYLVNWDPVTETALADDEVEYEERMTSLWTIRYPIHGEDTAIFVSTTRPETMLADTAVGVHPHDERYKAFIGKMVELPLTGRLIPIIADEMIERDFGTGAVKVTPAHDHADYQLALRHNLPMMSLFTKSGIVNEVGGRFAGLSAEEARKQVVEALKQGNFLAKIEPYHHRVGVSYRSKAIIEPMLSLQWFVRATAFKDILRNYVEKKTIKIVPQIWETTYFQWIDNLRDWCISRQLWWGHRIPVWYKKDDPNTFICFEGEGEPEEVQKDKDGWVQDPDVLDTWFSSALWPFSTLGWPENTRELEKFYPNSTLITGHDILFFWVARMIMMGHFANGKPPFHETFIHGLIYGKSYWRDNPGGGVTYCSYDEKKNFDLGKTPTPSDVKSRWEKMSKSKGNVIDPMEIIKEYGADAMRLALSASTTDSAIIELDRRRFEEFRHFVNKLWNGARFVIMKLTGEDPSSIPLQDVELYAETLQDLKLEDSWILSRLSKTIAVLNEHLSKYAFDKATTCLYEFFWNEFCAFYIEISKPYFAAKGPQKAKKQAICLFVLIDILKLLHPFAPFITEEIFSLLKERLGSFDPQCAISPRLRDALSSLSNPLLASCEFPQVHPEDQNEAAENLFTQIQAVISSLRAIRGEMKIPPSMPTDLYFIGKGEQLDTLKQEEQILHTLIKLGKVLYPETQPNVGIASRAVVEAVELIVPLPEAMKEQEASRVKKSIERIQSALIKLEAQLAQVSSNEKTPEAVVQKIKGTIDQQKKALSVLQEQAALLS
jgi:valyl-tRNA synthetase